jgi:hypothetical protein
VVEQLEHEAVGLQPGLTLLLDLDVRIGRAAPPAATCGRTASSASRTISSSACARAFRSARRRPGPVPVIDAGRSLDEVAARARGGRATSGGIGMSAAALTPWQQRVYDHAASALDAGRLGHGLLLCGPAGLGKRAVASAWPGACCAGWHRRGADANHVRCRQLIAAGTHPDLQQLSFVPTRPATSCAPRS